MGSVEQAFDTAQALRKYGIDVNAVLKAEPTAAGALATLYPKQTIRSVADYEEWSKSLWSLQQRVKPALAFQPKSAQEVAIAVLLCRHTQTKFAVKSGGHAAMEGASSIKDGITIDLGNMNSVDLNEDKSIARIGAGGRWEHVFGILGKEGLGVAGGRSGGVGVGGYTLGGGISFFASATGWACDTVQNYELVSAEGEILNVTRESYPDLSWALRGGGPNFGIVTRFDYKTFPQNDIFAGSLLYHRKDQAAVVKAYATYALNADPKAATWLTYVNHEGNELISALGMYADPSPEVAFLKPYLSIPCLHNTAKVRSIADMTHEIQEVNVTDHRQCLANRTFKFDSGFVSWLGDMFYDEMREFASTVESKQGLPLVLQIYTKESIRMMQKNGGNCLGLREEDAPYLNVLASFAWMRETDDERVYDKIDRVFELAITEAKRRGLYTEFIYMNYSSCYQDVLKGYGKENYDRLKAIASKYDPDSVFQTLMPGYFKFGGAPKSRK